MSNEPQTVRATRDPAIVGASSQDEARAIAERDWRKHPADTGSKAIAIIKHFGFSHHWYSLSVVANVMANGGRPQELTTTEHWQIAELLPPDIRQLQWGNKREVMAAVKEPPVGLPLPYPVLPGIWQDIPNAPLRRI